ncbi:DUF998 domain-containing protein [Nonomuraea typhae]|uniref:DUF998 domain-containing protein n=1 Tax=Nonomuraea typhae TaxID=2603600 RepID=UPI0012F9F18A|nr:DUF998 domain-containing protein [Nonomuraea typhae]
MTTTRTRVTRTLLTAGVVAGPLYVAVGLAQAFTREGFDLTRHQWSLLANGELGWIQVANFLVAALATGAAAVGMHRAGGSPWASRLIAVYALSLVGAAVFKADPAMGFPAGTPEGPGVISAGGMLHLLCGLIGFVAVGAACFVVARRFGPLYSRVTGVLFLLGFAAVAIGAGAVWANLAFTAAILLIWTWLAVVSLHYRRTV